MRDIEKSSSEWRQRKKVASQSKDSILHGGGKSENIEGNSRISPEI